MEIWVVSEMRIHAGIEGSFPRGILRKYLWIHCRNYRYFGEFMGDKTVEDFKGILGDSQEKSWESSEKSGEI